MQRNRAKSIKRSKRQLAWQYMRRNPIFSVNDILLILEMSEKSLMLLIRQLSHAGYIKQLSGGRIFRHRVYKLLRNTGVICPQWIDKQKRLYDPNLQEMHPKDVSIRTPIVVDTPGELRPIDPMDYDAGRIKSVLEGEDAGLTLLELRERSGISAARFASVLHSMKREGTVIQVGKREGVPVYKKGVSDEAVS